MTIARPLGEGALFANQFRILRTLGEGGMGVVYVAEQLGTGKARALKTMHAQLVANADLRERFMQEARIGARIDSEHIVDVVAAGIDVATGMPWLAMELLTGETVADAAARGAFDVERRFAEHALLQLGDALACAHEAGVVHRDLKPENLFLARTKQRDVPFVLKVLDFGIAKLVMQGTGVTASVGTPMWMAPEQTELGARIAPSTDVWAFGLIAFYLFSGRPYWRLRIDGHEVSVPILLRQILIDDLPIASERARALGCHKSLPNGFDAWFRRCVARSPHDRFANGGQALAALRALLDPPVPPFASTAPALPARTLPLATTPSCAPMRAPTDAGLVRSSSVPPPPPRGSGAVAAVLGGVALASLVAIGVVGSCRRPARTVATAGTEREASRAIVATSAPIEPAEGRTLAAAPVELRWTSADPNAEHEIEIARGADPATTGQFPRGVSYALWPWSGAAAPGGYAWRVREGAGAWSEWSRFAYYPSVLDRVADTKKLRVAMETTFHEPFVYYDVAAQRVVGFDVELAAALADNLGVTLERESREWSQLFDDVQTRHADVAVSAVTITPDRSRTVTFSEPYVQTGVVVTTRASVDRVAPPGAGRVLAAQRATTASTTAAKLFPKATHHEYDTLDAAFAALARGEVDGLLSDEIVIRSRPEVRAGAYRVHGPRLTKDAYGVMLPLGDERFRVRINAALRDLETSGKLAEMRARFGLDR
ncbi:MAG: transporter substrate-binding domain-containing protein [Labilithrix sp.]|nr:transporter substrate-binding domain-containing protein [Labilithrix sp.]